MFCPYCKNTLENRNGELYCNVGCYFSKDVSTRFNEKIKNLVVDENMNINNEGRFFCVNCVERMKKIGVMNEKCSNCGFNIDKSDYYKIIEFNPHEGL
jgi:hypothetical protein